MAVAALSVFLAAASAVAAASAGAGRGARLYDPTQARAFASLAKLTYCGPGDKMGPPYGSRDVLPRLIREASGDFCERAGFKVTGALGVSHSSNGQANAEWAYVAKLKAHEPVAVPRGRSATLGARPAAAAVAPADCLLAFRGTWVKPANSRANSNHSAVELRTPSCPEGCKVIGGAYGIWEQLKPKLLSSLEQLGCPKGSSLAFTGHSLGGQVASIAMLAFQDELGYDVALSYTFEQPRVFNEKAVKVFEGLFHKKRGASFFRVTHTNDDVPRFPEGRTWRQPGFHVWYYGNADAEKYELCGRREGCGVDALDRDDLCSMNDESERCGGSGLSGPHCSHPLAPAGNFCNMAGSAASAFEVASVMTCMAGDPMPREPIVPTDVPAVWPGDVELPLQERNLLPAEQRQGCWRNDTAASPLGLPGLHGLAVSQEADAFACQRRCARTAACAFFTYRPVLGTCELTGVWGMYTPHVLGAVAGPKDCAEPALHLTVAEKLSRWHEAVMGAYAVVAPRLPAPAAAALPAALAAAACTVAAVALALRRSVRRHGAEVLLDVEAPAVE